MKKILPFILILFILTGCSSDDSGSKSGVGDVAETVDGGTIRLGCVPVDTLNPLITTRSSVGDVLSLVYEGLFVTLEDLTVSPVLAASVSASENNTLYTVKLKDSVKFHNGKAMTSDDVVATLDYIRLFGGRYSSALSQVETYGADGKNAVFFRLKKSVSDFANNLDFPILPAGLKEDDFLAPNSSFVPVGTGMYKYDSTIAHKNIYFKANENWHTGKRAHIDTVDVSILTDEATIVSAFDIGALDVISTSWKTVPDMNLTSEMFNVFETGQNRYTFIGINTFAALFDTAEERRTLSDIINEEALTDEIMPDYASVAKSPLREGVYFNPEITDEQSSGNKNTSAKLQEDKKEETDSKAEETTDSVSGSEEALPEETGTGESGLKECRILYNQESKSKTRLAAAVKRQLEAGGYFVVMDQQPYSEYEARVYSGSYDLYIGEIRLSNNGDVSFMFGSGAQGLCNYQNSEFATLVDNIDLMTNKEDKIIAWTNFENAYIENAVQIPVYFVDGAALVNKKISGVLKPNLSNLYYGFEDLFIENEK